MDTNKYKDMRVIGPLHPSFWLERAWYMFGIFNQNGSTCRFILVEAENSYAVHLIEMLVYYDNSVSATCGLMSTYKEKPQVCPTSIQEMFFFDFMIDMVDPERWLDSPAATGLFEQSISRVDKVMIGIKFRSLMEAYRQKKMEERINQSIEEERKFEQLNAGLIGLGFSDRKVREFVSSVRDRQDPLGELLTEGIDELNRSSE